MESKWNNINEIRRSRSISSIDNNTQMVTLGSGEAITAEEFMDREAERDRAQLAYNDILTEIANGLHGPVTQWVVI